MIRRLDLTLHTPAENLALDEAILNQMDEGRYQFDILRFWEPQTPFVVLGRGSKYLDESPSRLL